MSKATHPQNGLVFCSLLILRRNTREDSVDLKNNQNWDGMGREVGGGFRMGNTCTPVADSFQVWQKPLQYCKVLASS